MIKKIFFIERTPLSDNRVENPFQGKDGKWYYYDETEDVSKAYDTKEEASKALSEYASWLNEKI